MQLGHRLLYKTGLQYARIRDLSRACPIVILAVKNVSECIDLDEQIVVLETQNRSKGIPVDFKFYLLQNSCVKWLGFLTSILC